MTKDQQRLRILIAPDSLKETMGSGSAASAIAAGVREVMPAAELILAPVADGGEGTLDVLAAAIPDLEVLEAEVVGPRPDRPSIRARWGLGKDRRVAVVELAEACGLARLEIPDRDPLATSTHGVGQLLETARARLHADLDHPSDLVLALGGSATVDGGIGAARALGIEIEGPAGSGDRPLVGADLEEVRVVRWNPEILARWSGIRLRIAGDVVNPLLGPEGAAGVYGPQKGADQAAIDRLESGLARWLRIMEAFIEGPCGGSGTGAAGGIPVGLAPWVAASLLESGSGGFDLSEQLESGFEVVADVLGLRRRLKTVDLLITSEGSLDRQSMMGKTVGRLVDLAEEARVPVVAVPGTTGDLGPSSAGRFAVIRALDDEVGPVACKDDPADALRKAAGSALQAWIEHA